MHKFGASPAMAARRIRYPHSDEKGIYSCGEFPEIRNGFGSNRPEENRIIRLCL